MVLKCCPLCNASDLRTNPRNRHHVGLEFCIGLKKIKVLLKVFLKVFLQRGWGGYKVFSSHHCLLVYQSPRHLANVHIYIDSLDGGAVNAIHYTSECIVLFSFMLLLLLKVIHYKIVTIFVWTGTWCPTST